MSFSSPMAQTIAVLKAAVVANPLDSVTRFALADALTDDQQDALSAGFATMGGDDWGAHQRFIGHTIQAGRTQRSIALIGFFPVKLIARLLHYRARKVILYITTSVTLHGTDWSGGSRDEYWRSDLNPLMANYEGAPIVSRMTGAAVDLNPLMTNYEGAPIVSGMTGAPFGDPNIPVHDVGNGYLIVRGGTFQGRRATLTLNVHPNDLPFVLGWEGK